MIISIPNIAKINNKIKSTYKIENIILEKKLDNVIIYSKGKSQPNIRTIISKRNQADFKDYEELQEWVLMKTQNWIEKSCLVERKLMCN